MLLTGIAAEALLERVPLALEPAPHLPYPGLTSILIVFLING